MKNIHLWGVKQNNLKGIEVKIPLGSLTVVCGPSGSGKSSLAFETLYAEGQRRYIESLSNYTKQFLNKAPKPDIEGIENIPPAISIEQKNSVKSSRSTVGTTTEVLDYLRLLFEKIGKAYCPDHHIPLTKDNVSSGTQKILRLFQGQRGYVLAKISEEHRALKGKPLLANLIQEGYLRIYIPPKSASATKTKAAKKSSAKRKSTKKVLAEAAANDTGLQEWSEQKLGEVIDIKDPSLLKKGAPAGDFYLVIDRLAFNQADEGRVADSLAQAYSASIKYNTNIFNGQAMVITTEGRQLLLGEEYSCSICDYRFPNITAKLFSFNSPVGACEKCNGFGNILMVDEAKVIPNPKLSLAGGALKPFTMPSARRDMRALLNFCKKAGIDQNTPWEELPEKHRRMVWQGTEDFFGVEGLFEYLETKKYKMHVRVFLARHKSPFTCPTCKGSRLRKEAQQVFIQGQTISDLSAWPIEDLLSWLKELKLSPSEKEICDEIFRQGVSRLQFLCEVGVGYLTLDRPTKTLSGGEYQRLSLSNQLGMGLSQTLYVLDEPTVGLHPRDNDRLIGVLKHLRDLGNTLVVVEHDHDVIKNSTHVIEMGPGSGHLGGDVIFAGDREEFFQAEKSNTVKYLTANAVNELLRELRPVDINTYRYRIDLEGVTGHNLQNVDVSFPLNRLVTVTGVSGSGKSSLVSQTLYPAVARELNVDFIPGLEFKSIKGVEHIKNVLFIDQSPVGKTARSCPATYLKVFDAIRSVMASTPEAKSRGYTAGTFSLNVDGGRCPVCKGMGFEVVDMMFMDDIYIPCDACDSKKYRPEILDVTYKNKNIADILDMTVSEAMDFFVAYPNIRRPLGILKEVGLDYIRLGQPANTLSGGESQRLKIAREFDSSSQKATLYILDEPTTGLHFREVHLLLKVLNRLIEAGGSVLLIEHNLEIIRNSDYIIDLGPEAGEKGGKVIAHGSPEDIIRAKKGHTSRYLRQYLEESNTTSDKGRKVREPSSRISP